MVPIPTYVAVTPWWAPFPLVTIIVKATASFRGEGPRRQAEFIAPRPLKVGPARLDDDAPRPDDFVPNKNVCDVLLAGHVQLWPMPSGAPTTKHARLTIGSASTSFEIGGGPGRVPLRPPFLRVDGEPEARLAASPTEDPEARGYIYPDEFDYDVYQSAHEALRIGRAEARTGSTIAIDGLADDVERLEIVLPQVGARAIIDWARDDHLTDAELMLDTIVIDWESSSIDLVWRGFVLMKQDYRKDVDRIIVGFASDEDWERGAAESVQVSSAMHAILAELPRGTFSYAWERAEAVEQVEPPPLPRERFEMARLETLDAHRASRMALTLQQHARIAAELLDARETRHEILRRHGLDDFGWTVEERALGGLVRSEPIQRVESIEQEYALHFEAAQEALARPEERRFILEDYVTLAVRLEVEDPTVVLAEAGISQGAWMRIERYWRRRAGEDTAVERDMDARFAAERGRRGEAPVVVVDDLGRIVS